MKDLKIPVTRSSMPAYDEYTDEIKELWQTHWLTNTGTKHNELETALKEYLSVNGLSLFCNGHLALELCLQAFGLTGEVITTPFTFASTTHAIVRNGLEPVFCDINDKNYTIDAEKIDKLITDKTSAILPVHVYGNMCDVDAIERIAKKHNLKVIYDAAHVFGVRYRGASAVSFGDAAMLSFHATKVFHTIEGGAICCQDEAIIDKLKKLKNFGIADEDVVDCVGSNAKMNEFEAAMGLCNLRHIDEEISKRKTIFELYQKYLSESKGLKLPEIQQGIESNYAYFPILVDENDYGINRDKLKDKLALNGIFARKYFYPLTNSFDCYHGKYDVNQTPAGLKISKQVLALPMYADLTAADIAHICNVITKRNEY